MTPSSDTNSVTMILPIGVDSPAYRFEWQIELCFKSEPHCKIEVHRSANAKPLLFPDDPAIAGIATDAAVETTLPVAHLDDIPAIAAMMQRFAVSVEDVLARSVSEA